MSGRPEVSVAIPSYNHAAYIEAAVASVLDQGGPESGLELELVVVDDGSRDDSVERLRAIDDPRLRLEVQENRGAHAALERAIGLCTGDLVFILNSDDLFAPGRIKTLIERFRQEPGTVLCASWLEVIDDAGQRLGIKEAWRNMPPWPRPRPGPGLAELGDPLLALLESNYIATTSNVAFRRSLVSEPGVGFAPLRYAHDWEFLLAASRHGDVALIPEPLVGYRVHASNTIAEGRQESGEQDEEEATPPDEHEKGTEKGQGAMRFEILWLVARHAPWVLRRAAERPDLPDWDELVARAWRGMPRFGRDDLLAQLLALRGNGDAPPPHYDRLLDPAHPWRRAAIQALSHDP